MTQDKIVSERERVGKRKGEREGGTERGWGGGGDEEWKRSRESPKKVACEKKEQ